MKFNFIIGENPIYTRSGIVCGFLSKTGYELYNSSSKLIQIPGTQMRTMSFNVRHFCLCMGKRVNVDLQVKFSNISPNLSPNAICLEFYR